VGTPQKREEIIKIGRHRLEVIKALEVRCLSNDLYISTTTVQLSSFILSSFIDLLLTLDSSGVLPTFALDYNPLLYKAPSKFILSLPPFIPYTAVDSVYNSIYNC
jgi:hypothetical protein